MLDLDNSVMACVDPADHIKIGSYYEIDHSKLPPKSPDQLNSIRIVMVSEKTRMRVSLRFPSLVSLKTYFYSDSTKTKLLPAFDVKFIVGSETAAETLYRRVPPQEITDKKNIWRFWAVPCITAQKLIVSNRSFCGGGYGGGGGVKIKQDYLLSQIKDTGMVKWGQKRQVRYLARHNTNPSEYDQQLILVNKEEESEESDPESSAEDDDEVKKKKMAAVKKKGKSEKSLKRKFSTPTTAENNQKNKKKTVVTKKPKTEKNNNYNNQIVVYKQKKLKVFKNSYDRWSAERYHLAEVNMLKIMKEQNAVFGRPILRPELRAHARRLIGDTGLLDHLLKHMAGKVAPGGEDRFRRRHNAEGAMEYWLESADLIEIRREAGVQDPYWIPPPGWSLGDNPTQDPLCSRAIKQLNQEVDKLKRDMELLSKKHDEEELAIETVPMPCGSSPNIDLMFFKEMYIDLANKKAKVEEILLEFSHTIAKMEEKLKTRMEVEEGDRKESSEAALMELPEIVQHKKAEEQHTEDKAAKIERLKSGFKICKPQGSFIWPNNNNNKMVQFEDMIFSLPTPPSVSSTSASQPHLLLPATPATSTSPPVKKPLAEKGPVTITTLSSAVTTYDQSSKTTDLINLNEPPTNQNDNISPQTHGQPSSFPVTYQRRNSTPTTPTVPSMELAVEKKEMMNRWEGNDQGKELIRCCSASSTASSCFSVGAGPWLALSASDAPAASASKSDD
ncbi:protein DYAD [Mercurialis annua]|uniref:protein DYAD n=1 Tax=Mercurialis annua TaxID=3986 RepID=UPI0021604CEF|nr:protein DYAD [Mercurialis annua]